MNNPSHSVKMEAIALRTPQNTVNLSVAKNLYAPDKRCFLASLVRMTVSGR